MTSLNANMHLDYDAFSLDASMALPGSGVSALYGPSGSGKTTILKCLAGLIKARGSCNFKEIIWQNDQDKVFVPPHLRRIGFVFQDAQLFPHFSVYDNVCFSLKYRMVYRPMEKVGEIAELLGITHLLKRMPHNLSGGEKQRVALARALVSDPEILFLDEPLASLDSSAKKDILSYLETIKLTLNIPMLYVSHAPEEIFRLADFVVTVDKGRISRLGTLAVLGHEILKEHDISGTVISGKVMAIDRKYFLSKIDFHHHEIFVPGIHQLGRTLYMQILAKDVSLTKQIPEATSILNILPVVVISVTKNSEASVIVELSCASTVLYSAITQKSCDLLGLYSGMPLFAQIKTISLDYVPTYK